MYDDVYNALVESGNAIKSQEPTSKYEGALKTQYHLTRPQNCLVVDEVGTNTIIKKVMVILLVQNTIVEDSRCSREMRSRNWH